MNVWARPQTTTGQRQAWQASQGKRLKPGAQQSILGCEGSYRWAPRPLPGWPRHTHTCLGGLPWAPSLMLFPSTSALTSYLRDPADTSPHSASVRSPVPRPAHLLLPLPAPGSSSQQQPLLRGLCSSETPPCPLLCGAEPRGAGISARSVPGLHYRSKRVKA